MAALVRHDPPALCQRRRCVKKPILLLAVLTMVLATAVPGFAQDGEYDVIPAEEPVTTCAWGPTEVSSPANPYAPNALDPSDHVPGEFRVTFESVEAMWAAPQENVKETNNDCGW